MSDRRFLLAFSTWTQIALTAITALPILAQTEVLTYHNDNLRTGLNQTETTLTKTNVNSASFGKLFSLAVDGKVDAQPLIVANLSIPNKGTHNVVFVVTEHDSVYAFDADSGSPLWQVSLLKAGETTSDARGCGQVSPEIGITATPVIDKNIGPHGTIYVVAMSKDASSHYFQRLHALDITTGAEQLGGPINIAATAPGTGDNSTSGTVVFDPKQYKSRPGLLLVNGVVYTSWSSHCDIRPYTGWAIGYNSTTLAQTSVFNFAPNGNEAAVWNSGAGPAADQNGNLFFSLANGTFDTTLDINGFPTKGDYGNAFIKLTPTGGQLKAADYWTMDNTVAESSADQDLGSGGMLLLPDVKDSKGVTRHLGVGAGKDRNIYMFDRDNMGKFSPTTNMTIYQELVSALAGGEFGTAAWFNNTVYFGAVSDAIRAFTVSSALLSATPASTSAHVFGFPGTTPSISANGTANGILWAAENTTPAVLHAYDASNLATELYNSSQAASGRDNFGNGNKFITPTIANGKVYVGTTNSVGVFGLLAPPAPTVVSLTPVNGTGSTQTFSVTYADGSGAANLNVMFLLFNSSLNGANGCWIYYVHSANALYLVNDAGDGGVPGGVTPGTAGSPVSNSQCSISNGGPVTASGNNLTVPVSVTFSAAFGGGKNVYGYANDNAGLASDWQTLGTWSPTQSQAPKVVGITPINGTGSPQTFRATFSDASGVNDLNTMFLLFNSTLSGTNGCWIYYLRSSNSLYLVNDAGSGGTAGAVTPGVAGGTASNSQCTISNGGAVSISGNNLTVPVNIAFSSSFGGLKSVYAYANNSAGTGTDWQTLGTWTPTASQAPTITSVTPINGTGASQTFTATFSESSGAADLNLAFLLFNSSLSGVNGCWVYYVRSANQILLLNDAGTVAVAGAVTPGVSGTPISNSQCTLSNGGPTIASGSNLTVPVSITFAPSFTGVKSVFGYVANNEGLNTGWRNLGTWTPR